MSKSENQPVQGDLFRVERTPEGLIVQRTTVKGPNKDALEEATRRFADEGAKINTIEADGTVRDIGRGLGDGGNKGTGRSRSFDMSGEWKGSKWVPQADRDRAAKRKHKDK